MEKEMRLNEYQKKAMTTCMESSANPLYMLFMLGEEIGELQGKFSKAIRKGKMRFNGNEIVFTDKATDVDICEWEDLVAKECGDILWGVAGMCEVMGWTLEDVAQMNLDKLAARKAIGTIDGNGDGIERSK
jgi:NTP pyrophosphatase (non-canonical NTP hydrolase)